MKLLLIIFSVVIYSSSISQTTLPDNFKVNGYIEVFNNDSIKVYFNCTGSITNAKCAAYYRVGKIDSTSINVTGVFTDYYLNGKVRLRATMINNSLEGLAQYYYENGKINEEGNYEDNQRIGKWTFYYPNGNVEKVYNYIDDKEPDVLEAYNRKGKPTVVNGNGNFTTEFRGYKGCYGFEVSGKLLNGKRDGKWTFSNPGAMIISTDVYENGNYVKTISNGKDYIDKPSIHFISYYPNEELNFVENYIGCPGDHFSVWGYNNKNMITTFYPDLQETLNQYNNTIKDQWLIIGIKISKTNSIDELNVASSINDTAFENYVHDVLSKMTLWQTASINNRKMNRIFFSQF